MRAVPLFFVVTTKLIVVCLTWSPVALAQDSDSECDPNSLLTGKIVVPLDATGIGDWGFLNPRAPFPLLRKSTGFRKTQADDGCWAAAENLKKVQVEFHNRTSNRTFNVSMELEQASPFPNILETFDELLLESAERRFLALPPPAATAADSQKRYDEQLLDQIKDANQNIQNLKAQRSRKESASEIEKADQELEEEQDKKRKIQVALLNAALNHLDAEDRELVQAELLLVPEKERIRWLASRFEREVKKSGDDSDDDPYTKLNEAFETYQKSLSPFRKAKLPSNDDIEKARNGLDAMRKLIQAQAGLSWAGPYLEISSSAFSTLTQIQQDINASEGGGELAKACKKTAGNKLSCKRIWTIQPRSKKNLSGDTVALFTDASGVRSFSVSFVGDPDIPDNSTGYFRTAENIVEPKSSTSWNLSASVSAQRAPEFVEKVTVPSEEEGKDDEVQKIPPTVDNPYDGNSVRQVKGSGSFKLKQTLGNRALGTATLAFKNGAFGAADQTDDVVVSEYTIQTYGMNDLQFRFGKYRFLSSLQANPKGEGLELYLRGFSIGHIINRESLSGEANDADQDSRITFILGENLRLSNDVRMDVFALQGEDENPAEESKFKSYGLTAYFDTQASCKNSKDEICSAYGADLDIGFSEIEYGDLHPEPADEGEGWHYNLLLQFIDLASPNEVKAGDVKKGTKVSDVQRTYSIQYAQGDGDEATTPEMNEGYSGPSAGFSVDKIFLAALAPNLLDEQGRKLGGLTNMRYLGLNLAFQQYSPLEPIWELFDAAGDIQSRSTRFSVHRYKFQEPVFGNQDIGYEMDVDFNIEAPKGITTSVGLGYFFADEAFAFVDKDPWVFDFKVSLNL